MEITEVPFGFIKGGKIFRSSWGDHPDREIGEVREEDDQKSIQFFEDRFNDLSKKVNEVIEKIESTENKGSFLMKLVHLKEQLPAHDGLGDYAKILEKLTKYESLVRDIIQKNRARNTEIKTALIQETNEVENIVNWKEATDMIHDIKSRWIKTGSADEEKNDELEEDFWKLVTAFFEKKKNFYEDKLKLTEHRKTQYETLVNDAEKVKELFGKQKFELINSLKERWKEIGGVPAEIYKPLFDEFNKKLKDSKRPFVSKVDYSSILQKLEEVKAGNVAYDKNELDGLKKSIYKDRSRNEEKSKALELIQLLNERDFVLKLANKRFSDFPKMDKEKKKTIKMGIIKDLIQRDMDDLKVYEENSANFSSSDGSMNKLVESKINGQRKKIDVKKKLLNQIELGEF